jgi:putative peptide zinc metalloprotease protein
MEPALMNTGAPLYSPHWYRIGPLHPRLPAGTRIQRQTVRGEDWFVLTRPVDGRHHRVNRQAYALIGRLDGQHSLDTLWNGLQNLLGDELPTQDEVIHLLSQLSHAGLVLFDTEPDWSFLRQSHAVRERHRRAERNPFAFRIRLPDPAPLLDRLAPLQRLVFHPLALMAGAVLLLGGLAQAVAEWPAIRSYAATNLPTPRLLFLTWLAYPFIKAVHELGHALVVRRWGGDVREAGIAVYMFMPAPYVDASSADAFGSKWQRAAVSSAGIAVELLLAAAALFLWSAVADGVVRELAFVVMAIGGLSSLVFNANPLLRFDGYYILSDLLELPNLAARSQRWWGQRLAHFFMGGGTAALDELRGDEKFWIPVYAPASWLYRIGMSVLIVQWLIGSAPYIGLAAMAWLAFPLFVKPLWAGMRALLAPRHPGASAWPPLVRMGGAAAALSALLWIPIPTSTVAPGMVWLPEHSQVRTESSGRVVSVLAKDGQRVVAGQPLIVLGEPSLLARKEQLEALIHAAETDQASGWLNAGAQGRNAAEQLLRLRQDLAQVLQQLDHLTLRAAVDGEFVMPQAGEMLQRDVPKGALLAYVLASDPTIVRAAIAQDDIGRIRAGVRRVSVWLAEADGSRFDARLARVEPAASTRLPGMALGDRGGGNLVTDPADHEGMKLLDPVFLVDVSLPERALLRAGGHAWVRFDHEAQPLAQTLQLRLRQLFLKAFDMKGA